MIVDPNIPELQLETQGVEGLKVYRVPTTRVDEAWPFVVVVLRKYPELWQQYFTEDTLREVFLDGSATLWFVMRGGIIDMMFATNIVTYPTGRALNVFWGVGKGMSEWLPLVLSALYNFAARGGLQWVNIDGRLGWKKPLAAHGYLLTSVRYTKLISATETVN